MNEKCKVCNYSGNFSALYTNIHGTSLYNCPKCSVQFLYPQASDEQLKEIYGPIFLT